MITYTDTKASPEEVYGLYKALGWTAYLDLTAEQIALAMTQSWFVVNAYADSLLVGSGRVISDGVTSAYLCGLGVRPEYRCQGIATEIIARLVDECRRDKLHVQFFCDEALVSMYEKLGFTAFAVGMKHRE